MDIGPAPGGPARGEPAREDNRPASAGLFRREALAEQQTRWLGTVLVAPGIGGGMAAAFALAMAGGVIALLAFADYTRKARIIGWLVPDAGMVRVFTPRQGVVARLQVREGEPVDRGAALLTISTEVATAAFGETGRQVAAGLRGRRTSLETTREREAELFGQQDAELGQRIAMLGGELEHLGREASLQQERLELAERGAARQRLLRAQSLATAPRLERTEEDLLDQALRLQTLERTRAGLERERAAAAAEREALPLRRAQRRAQTDREIAEIERAMLEAEAQREIVVTAPEGGIVTAVLTELGSGVSATTPLLAIVPREARLEAQLFGPSSAIGFVRPGQRVRLRYAAYPYQKFGHHQGEVLSVSRASIGPSELPQRLAGLTVLQSAGEPLYRITVGLARQTVAAYGEDLPLQPGMQLEADVLIERRRLYEWALDPLYTMTGRWRS